MRALLVQPPVYDTQFYPEWSLPSGLLKISTWLRKQGMDVRLLDCLFPKEGEVPQKIKSVVQVCSTLEWPLEEYKALAHRRTGRYTRELPQAHRYKYEFGMPLEAVEKHLKEPHLGDLERSDRAWVPDEVWITSIMTYWWESTRDMVVLLKRLYPKARFRVGGIYPTLAPHHLQSALSAKGFKFEVLRGGELERAVKAKAPVGDCIATGEIPEAAFCDLDFEVYRQMTRQFGDAERLPDYAILITSRGCPFDCAYCAQRAYNGGSLRVRVRSAEATFAEIKDKYENFKVRRFAFYEDNFLVERDNIEKLLRMILEAKKDMPFLRFCAPEGVEVRLLQKDPEFVRLMKDVGFENVYLPLETMSRDVTKAWNRRHSHAGLFEEAVKVCQQANFKLHDMEVNAFVLFGMPGERLQDVVNTIFYASEKVGGIVPMLFTPVPGSIMFEQYSEYLLDEMGFDLHHLNGKLYPFLEYNFRESGVSLADYVALESLSFRLNAKTLGKTFQLDRSNAVYSALLRVLGRKGVLQ